MTHADVGTFFSNAACFRSAAGQQNAILFVHSFGTRQHMTPPDRAHFSLRPYRGADHDAVLAVFASNTPAFFAPSEALEFAAFLREPRSDLMVATSEAADTIGFGAAYCRTADEGGLAWGMVQRDWHRKGVGQALLDARVAHLRTRGVRQIRVHSSPYSAGFFSRSGFVVVAVVTNGFAPGIDQVTMRLHDLRGDSRA